MSRKERRKQRRERVLEALAQAARDGSIPTVAEVAYLVAHAGRYASEAAVRRCLRELVADGEACEWVEARPRKGLHVPARGRD